MSNGKWITAKTWSCLLCPTGEESAPGWMTEKSAELLDHMLKAHQLGEEDLKKLTGRTDMHMRGTGLTILGQSYRDADGREVLAKTTSSTQVKPAVNQQRRKV